jgi:hypothetical protein
MDIIGPARLLFRGYQVQIPISVYIIGGYRVVAVQYIVGGGAGASLHQIIALGTNVPDVEVGAVTVAVTFPLHV